MAVKPRKLNHRPRKDGSIPWGVKIPGLPQKTFDRKKDAEAWISKTYDDLAAGTHVAEKEVKTVEQVLRKWIEHEEVLAKTPGRKPSWLCFLGYRGKVVNHLIPAFGDMLLTELEKRHVQKWVDEMATATPMNRFGNRRGATRYKPDQLVHFVTPLRLALDFAVENKWLGPKGRNVLRGKEGKIVFADQDEDSKGPWLTRDDVTRLQATLLERQKGDYPHVFRARKVLFFIALQAGLRPGEVLGLQWENVDLYRREVHVRHTVKRQTGELSTVLKNPQSKRIVPMDPLLYSILVEEADLVTRYDGTPLKGYVVRDENGGPHSLEKITAKDVPTVMKRAGLVNEDGTHKFTLHKCRHYAGSNWIDHGVPLEEVSRRLGHGHYHITWRVYIHELPDSGRGAAGIDLAGRLQAQRLGIELPPIPERQAGVLALPAPTPEPPVIDHVPVNGTTLPAMVDNDREPLTIHDLKRRQVSEAKRFKQERDVRIVGLWKRGLSEKQIRKEVGVSRRTIQDAVIAATRDPSVRQARREAGNRRQREYQARKVGTVAALFGLHRAERTEFKRALNERIAELWLAGTPKDEIGRQLEVGEQIVGRVIADATCEPTKLAKKREGNRRAVAAYRARKRAPEDSPIV